MRTYPVPSILGWQLSSELGDNRSLKDRAAGKPEQIVATFNFYVQSYDAENKTYLAKDFDQSMQYPGSVIFTREQLEEGLASLHSIPQSLQQAALAMFESAAASNVVELSSHRPTQPERVEIEKEEQMVAAEPAPAFNMRG